MNIFDVASEMRLKDVRAMLRYNPHSSRKDKVIDAVIVGSVAKGSATNDSDIDIAVVIPRLAKSALKVTELYHSKFMSNSQMPHFKGYRVDLQFFYEGDPELSQYDTLPICTSK